MPKTILRMFSEGLPHDKVPLGSLTIDGIQPLADILHPCRPIPVSYIGEAFDAKIRNTFGKATSTNFKIFLTKVLKLAISSEDEQQVQVDAARRVNRYLVNHEQAFDFLTDEAVTEDEAAAGDRLKVQEWLQKRVSRRQDILMIVRTVTFVNANVLSGHVSAHSADGDASFSPSQAIPSLAPLAGVAEAGMTLGVKTEGKVSDGFRAIGDRIYAVEYRKVSWSWLKQAQGPIGIVGKIFKSLQPVPWTRGAGVEEEVTRDLLMRVESEGPQFTEDELTDESVEAYIEIDGENETEYIFDVEAEEESD